MTYEETPDLELSTKLFLGKSIVLYGASDTGKSMFICDILHHLSTHIHQYVIFAGTAECADDYEKLGARRPLIHRGIDLQILQEIWDRQEMAHAVFIRANKTATLFQLVKKLKLPQLEKFINELEKKRDADILENEKQNRDDTSRMKEETEKIKKCYNDVFNFICKRAINKYRLRLIALPLDSEETYTLEYINYNPNMVIIFDDCASDLQKYKNQDLIQDLFTKARHSSTTVILALQDDKMLPSELRKNAMVNIFTTNQCATALFNRSSNFYDKTLKNRAKVAIDNTFKDGSTVRKLIHVRKGDKFFRCIAEPRGKISLGSPALNEYCDKIANSNTSAMDEQNKYYKLFKIEPAKK